MGLLTQIVIAVVPVIVVVTGTAIYLNRRRSNKLHQRLFGLESDPADKGYIPEMNDMVNEIDANVKDLNHRRIDDIEARLDELQDSISTLERQISNKSDDE